jgi:RNA polymerase sigma-70 factor (ECF subfamily)
MRRAELTDGLASLDELSREALLLTTWDGLSGIDAARVLGLTPGALRVRVHRARTALKEVPVHD